MPQYLLDDPYTQRGASDAKHLFNPKAAQDEYQQGLQQDAIKFATDNKLDPEAYIRGEVRPAQTGTTKESIKAEQEAGQLQNAMAIMQARQDDINKRNKQEEISKDTNRQLLTMNPDIWDKDNIMKANYLLAQNDKYAFNFINEIRKLMNKPEIMNLRELDFNDPKQKHMAIRYIKQFYPDEIQAIKQEFVKADTDHHPGAPVDVDLEPLKKFFFLAQTVDGQEVANFEEFKAFSNAHRDATAQQRIEEEAHQEEFYKTSLSIALNLAGVDASVVNQLFPSSLDERKANREDDQLDINLREIELKEKQLTEEKDQFKKTHQLEQDKFKQKKAVDTNLISYRDALADAATTNADATSLRALNETSAILNSEENRDLTISSLVNDGSVSEVNKPQALAFMSGLENSRGSTGGVDSGEAIRLADTALVNGLPFNELEQIPGFHHATKYLDEALGRGEAGTSAKGVILAAIGHVADFQVKYGTENVNELVEGIEDYNQGVVDQTLAWLGTKVNDPANRNFEIASVMRTTIESANEVSGTDAATSYDDGASSAEEVLNNFSVAISQLIAYQANTVDSANSKTITTAVNQRLAPLYRMQNALREIAKKTGYKITVGRFRRLNDGGKAPPPADPNKAIGESQ